MDVVASFRTELRGLRMVDGSIQSRDAGNKFRRSVMIEDYAWEDNVLQLRMRIGPIENQEFAQGRCREPLDDAGQRFLTRDIPGTQWTV